MKTMKGSELEGENKEETNWSTSETINGMSQEFYSKYLIFSLENNVNNSQLTSVTCGGIG